MKEEIIDSKNQRFIGEFMNDLPENVMLNKVTTGCGMTSVVLENSTKYVLAVPFTALIKNKQKWCAEKGIDVCSVFYRGDNEEDIKAYKGNKIITTYDSLGKVTKALEDRGDLKDWKLCVDEAHKLVDSAAFRTNAVKNVLDNYYKYKSYVFGTATPVQDKYQLPALKHIPKIKIHWNNLIPVKVNYCHYDANINDVTAILALDFLNVVRLGNAHIFINSVSSICGIIKKMQKGGFNKHSSIRIVCADNPRNQNIIEKKLQGNNYISSVNSDVKKVNFYTATAFEGCDIYDEEGKSFVITDGSKDYTKIDIVTVLPQIVGRIRNSKYKNKVCLFYTKNQYITHVTEEEFSDFVYKNIEEAKKDIEEFGTLRLESSLRKNALEENVNPYLLVDGDNLLLNDAAWYNAMHNFSTMKETYYVSDDGRKSTIVNGDVKFNEMIYSYQNIKKIEVKGLNKIKLGRKPAFKDLCEDYLKIVNTEPSFIRSGRLSEFRKIEPFVVEAYDKLGEQKMRALEFRKTEIKEALLVISNEINKDSKMVRLLGFRNGEWINRAEVKTRIQEAYKKLGINKKAMATDLTKWYEYKLMNKRSNGKLLNGFVIVGCKIKLN
jgi:hypothetical protein